MFGYYEGGKRWMIGRGRGGFGSVLEREDGCGR